MPGLSAAPEAIYAMSRPKARLYWALTSATLGLLVVAAASGAAARLTLVPTSDPLAPSRGSAYAHPPGVPSGCRSWTPSQAGCVPGSTLASSSSTFFAARVPHVALPLPSDLGPVPRPNAALPLDSGQGAHLGRGPPKR